MERIMKLLTMSVTGFFFLSGLSVIASTDNIAATDNHPPDAPLITGPVTTTPGSHEWTFKAIDSDSDNISYEIDWGDGIIEKWIGPYASGEEVIRSHTYSVKMTISIRARANDTHGIVGDWGYLRVVISASEPSINHLFLQFMERLIGHFPILDRIFLFFQSFTRY